MMKRLYLCCKDDKRAFYKQKIEHTQLSSVLFVENIIEADKIICIGTMNKKMEVEISGARDRGIPISRVDENLISMQLLNDLLDNNFNVKQSREHEL